MSNPKMPNPLHPTIKKWVSFLKEVVKTPDEQTIILGHSLGAQTALRYAQSLNEKEIIGGIVLLAGFIHLNDDACEDEEDKIIRKPWIETPLDWEQIIQHTKKRIAIFSDNDPLVPLSDAGIFKNNLKAEIIIEHGRGHFSGSDGIIELPSALNAILRIASE